MEDFVQVEVTGDADTVTSELYVENIVENLVWYTTIEDNHVSMVSENIEKVIKLETDILDDCTWRSIIEITKDVDNQSIMELPLECQDVADNNIYLNHGNTSDEIFHCYICGKRFVLNHLLKNHIAEHKREVQRITHECKFCGKKFKFRFGLNRHIQNNHNSMYKCRYCRYFIECSKYIEHEDYHERKDSIRSIIKSNAGFTKNKLSDVIQQKPATKKPNGSNHINNSKCEVCGKIYSNRGNLKRHISIEHTPTYKPITCNFCSSTFKHKYSYREHLRNKHNKLY